MTLNLPPYNMFRLVEADLKGFRNLIEITYDKESIKFLYVLKHKTKQCRTNRFGYTTLITNTVIATKYVLKVYREKDVVEKAFADLKPHL